MFLARCVPGGEIPVFLASALSHLALDAIPHGDSGIGHWIHSAPDRKTKLSRLLPLSIADQIVAWTVFLILLRSPAFLSVPLPLLLAGAIGSMAPDYLTGFRDLLPRPPTWVEKLHRLHERCHFHGRDPFSALTGLILQALLLLLVCVFAFGRV